jgi:hypothetical protein
MYLVGVIIRKKCTTKYLHLIDKSLKPPVRDAHNPWAVLTLIRTSCSNIRVTNGIVQLIDFVFAGLLYTVYDSHTLI